jgi:hypothetical protein
MPCHAVTDAGFFALGDYYEECSKESVSTSAALNLRRKIIQNQGTLQTNGMLAAQPACMRGQC